MSEEGFEASLTEKEIEEQFERLTITNDFIFSRVMEDEEICQSVLQAFLGDDIHIASVAVQRFIDNSIEAKAVRLDVLAKDAKGNNYNIEMQVVNNDSIPKRMRMYQSSIDLDYFNKGEEYKSAKNTIVIFICMQDPIGQGLPIYTFENLCKEDTSIALGDGTLKVIVVPPLYWKLKTSEKKAILEYIDSGNVSSDFTRRLDMKVAGVKYNQVIKHEYLSFYLRMQKAEEDGEKRGEARGEAKERRETARRMKKKGCDFTFIAEMTGLKEEEIENL